MNPLKAPTEFAAEVLDMHHGDCDAASNTVIREINGRLKTCPTSWVRDVLRELARPTVVAGWEALHDEKGNWTGEVRNENGWTP